MGRQDLLPGFTVTDLVTVREAVAVCIDSAGLVRIHDHAPRPRVRIGDDRAIDSVADKRVRMDPSQKVVISLGVGKAPD